MSRKLTLQQAKARYPHRFTMEHVPDWAFRPHNGQFYAPQYRTDQEWYDNTIFPGEGGHHGFGQDCYSHSSSWPLGLWLERPFRPGRIEIEPLDVRTQIVLSLTPDASISAP